MGDAVSTGLWWPQHTDFFSARSGWNVTGERQSNPCAQRHTGRPLGLVGQSVRGCGVDSGSVRRTRDSTQAEAPRPTGAVFPWSHLAPVPGAACWSSEVTATSPGVGLWEELQQRGWVQTVAHWRVWAVEGWVTLCSSRLALGPPTCEHLTI